jgi:CRISPR type III-A-associated RAMP protein Csm4
MSEGLLIRLRPTGAWRIGPDSGDRDRVDRVYHSDSLYSAVASAMVHLGRLDAWLEATARAAEPAVRLGSCFPFQGDMLFVAPPRNLWPPPASSKVRWKGARFVPLSVVESLVAGRGVSEDRWMIDGASECLVPMATPPAPGPFRVSVRSNAAADRNGSAAAPHSTACLEFTPGSGLWTVATFSGKAARDEWTAPLTAAFRLLADSGFGGERSRGWGRSETPEIIAGELPGLLLKSPGAPAPANAWWLLSLFHPAASDAVDWTQGNYALTTRGGRVESREGWGEQKKATRMVAEGSVIVASAEPCGSAADVAPGGFAHPVYRAGFALAIPIPLRASRVTPAAESSPPPSAEPPTTEPPATDPATAAPPTSAIEEAPE